MRVVVPVLLFACLLAPPARAAAPCPPSLVTMGGIPSSTTSAAVFDTASWLGEVRWNTAAGSVYLHSYGSLSGIAVDAYDDFDVTGVPAGTPVPVQARLVVDGAVWTDGCGGTGCSGMYQVTFHHGADSLVVLHSDHLFTGRKDHHDELVLPLTIVAGTPERLRVRAFGRRNPGGAHESEADCRLSFVVQDPAISVVSCKAYALAPVPARPTSWGRLKSLYR